jgi:steroid 5-alpha reductase family enzyme
LRLVVGVISGLWGLRLGTHLYVRNAGKPEDGRYAKLRADWGAQADRRMLVFFLMQAVFALLLSLGMWTVAWQSTPVPALRTAAALLLAAVAIGGEALADQQLERFRSLPENRGRVCRQGLWGWSRHPNYFFECLHWPCYVILAWGAPGAWLTLVPPVVMVWLLLKVSGIPLNEAEAARKRPEYAEYIRTTSAFIPLPPRKS